MSPIKKPGRLITLPKEAFTNSAPEVIHIYVDNTDIIPMGDGKEKPVEGNFKPYEPGIEARLKAQEIIKEEDGKPVVDKYGLYVYRRNDRLITPEECAYATYLSSYEDEKNRKKVDHILYWVFPKQITIKVVKKEAVGYTKIPRSYHKTMAKYVGKDMEEPGLFTLPSIPEEKMYEDGVPFREVISKNTGILGGYMFQLWQINGKKRLEINNLSYLADYLNTTNYKIKLYLLYLGGFQYPVITRDKEGIGLETDRLFYVTFRYGNEVADKYGIVDKKDNEELAKAPLIGTNIARFIKNEPLQKVIVEPNPIFAQALQGGGFGSVLVVNDEFHLLALKLTEIAYKILTYSSTNRPKWTRGEDVLIKELGLEKQVKSQGKPRVLQTIKKGLDELKEYGHLESWSYDHGKKMFTYTYTDKYVKHAESRKRTQIKLEPENGTGAH